MNTFLDKVQFYCLASRERAKLRMFSPWVPLNKIRDRELSSAQTVLGKELKLLCSRQRGFVVSHCPAKSLSGKKHKYRLGGEWAESSPE